MELGKLMTYRGVNHNHKKRKDTLEIRVVLIEVFTLC